MQEDMPSDRIENRPEVDAVTGGSALHDFEPGTIPTGEIDPRIGTEFDAIAEDSRRERSRKAMRNGLAGPAVLCSAAIGCGFLGGIWLAAGAVLCGMAITSLVRVWKILPESTLLEDCEKATWTFRLRLTAAYVVLGGLILMGLSAVFLASFVPRRESGNVALQGAARSSNPAGAPPTRPRPAKDDSLALEDYIEAGMPDYDREWSGTDMATMVDVLSNLFQNDAGKLPRFQSPRSGPMFARMTADKNLELLRDSSLPLEQQIPRAFEFLQSTGTTLNLYRASYHKGATGSAELVELLGAQLRLWVIMARLMDEFVLTANKDDPMYAVRIQGSEQFRRGMATSASGALQTLTDRAVYDVVELKRLLGYMRETIPEILPGFPDANRRETIVRIRSFGKDPTMADLNPELSEFVDKIELRLDDSHAP